MSNEQGEAAPWDAELQSAMASGDESELREVVDRLNTSVTADGVAGQAPGAAAESAYAADDETIPQRRARKLTGNNSQRCFSPRGINANESPPPHTLPWAQDAPGCKNNTRPRFCSQGMWILRMCQRCTGRSFKKTGS